MTLLNSQPNPDNLEGHKGDAILVAVAEQLSKLVQVHQITEAAKARVPESLPLENADTVKQGRSPIYLCC
ncbi:MAG: hypothetical protein HC772_01805 [Leptolyngbyaceae cyanobacterium CRU_2_3]|nr:hypothetical protein [Leptolyngbyaceae cyanobacterium CRU_2_3]